ncbi:MAG: SIR2 family protein [Gammaproteobacteria bacterium]|nr:SIR2 family protein [Gammaproteobacteria bacterium]MDE0283542.1 SIR2 family protein [Gammaproteobacteria bacterium]
MEQNEFVGKYCLRPQNFAWFLGAGTSRAAGLPTATDILWDIKRRYYCREENQEISRQDIQNEFVKVRIQDFMESKGFPKLWADNEYSAYFNKIFGDDKERQRNYLQAILSEDHVSLSVGNRVMGGLLSSGHIRAVFTTNFDSVVEKAIAQTVGESLSAYHLEGSASANNALNNEEYPLYVKLHGDFRYEALKNLPEDLETQNEELSQCFMNAANRFGFIVIGYSGRDVSTMALFRDSLASNNPFPHGLYWMGIKGAPIHPEVSELMELAQSKGAHADYVEIETFDALMLRLWRNIEDKPIDIDKKIRRTQQSKVDIPLPNPGKANPIMRLNALPVLSFPEQCLKLTFRTPKTWSDLRKVEKETPGNLIFVKTDAVWCWGLKSDVKQAFREELTSVEQVDIPRDLAAVTNRPIKGFVEKALCMALARRKPLLSRSTRNKTFLIANSLTDDNNALHPLTEITGSISGIVPGVFTPISDEYPQAEQVRWSEAVQASLDVKDGNLWLTLNPDIWIWPYSAREISVDFMQRRRNDRFNKKFNDLISTWSRIIFGTDELNVEIEVSSFAEGSGAQNPYFRLASRTAFSKKLLS